MKSSFIFSLIVSSLLISATTSWAAEAQGAQAALESKTRIIDPPQKSWFVKVEGTPLLLGGFGIGVGHSISPKINGEIFYSQITLESEKLSETYLGKYDSSHKAKSYGIRINTLPFSDFDKGGWYVSAGLVQVDLKTEIDPVFSDEIKTLSAQKTGYNVFTGYMFKEGIFRSMSSTAIAGLGYGTGHAFSNNLGGTKNEILEGGSLDLSLAYNF